MTNKRGYAIELALGMIVLLLGTGTAFGSTFIVNADGAADYTRIQDAINNANNGDTILVSGGTTRTLTYYENVIVYKQLFLVGLDEGAGKPLVDAQGTGTVITVSGGATETLTGGSTIEGFIVKNSGNGGIGQYYAGDAGIAVYSGNNTIKNNIVTNNGFAGLSFYNSSNTINNSNNIFNNYFNNTINIVVFQNSNAWNTTKTPGINIIGGSYIGGNFWAKPDSRGFSQTCQDTDRDGICDSPFMLNGYNTDYLPLAYPGDEPPVANAGQDRSTLTGETINFDGRGSIDDNGIVQYEWDFESDGVYDASGVTASYVYTTAGNYTVTLMVTDTAAQTSTDTAILMVVEPSIVYNGLISSIITNSPKYLKGQTVNTMAKVVNTGNGVLNAQVRFNYIKPDLSVVYTEIKTVSVQANISANVQSSYAIPTKGVPQGTWTVEAKLIYDSQLLDVKTTTFVLSNKL